MQTRHSTALLILALCGCSRSVQVQTEPHAQEQATSVAAHAQLGWTTHAPMPSDLQEMAGAALGGKIYVVAGITNGVNKTIATTEIYDVASNTWTSGPPLPEPRHHAWAAALDGKLYVIGGYSSLDRPWPAHNSVFVFDPKTNAWTTRHEMPTARGALVVLPYKGKLYAIGGATPRVQLTTVEIYDPKTDSWTTGAPMPTAREHISGEVIGNRLFIAAGRAPKPGDINNFATLETYSPETNTWTTLAPMPTARGGLSTGVLGGKLYAFGGEYRGGFFDASEEYTPSTNTWRAVPTMSPARTGAVAATVNNRIYLIGGDGPPNSNAGTLTQSFGAVH
jgi:N-acetylneuraminic acid mutarotase